MGQVVAKARKNSSQGLSLLGWGSGLGLFSLLTLSGIVPIKEGTSVGHGQQWAKFPYKPL